MSEESWYDDYIDSYFDGSDLGIDCDFGLTEFCDNPDFRMSGNCFQCETYLEACKQQIKEVKE